MDGAISSAAALQMSFRLKPSASSVLLSRWRINFNHEVETASATASSVSVHSWSFSEFSFSVFSTLRETLHWLPFSLLVLLIFSLLSTFGPNAYKSKPLVGIQLFVAVVASSLAGAATLFSLSFRIDALLYPIFFVIIGIGVLFGHSMHSSWEKFSAAACSPSEKLAFVLAHDAPGMTLAALVSAITSLISWLACPWGLLRSSLLLLASSIAFLALFTLLFLTIFVFISGGREARGLKWFEFFSSGDPHLPSAHMAGFDSFSMFTLHDRLIDSRPSFARSLASLLTHRTTRYLSLFICAGFIIFAALACYNIEVDLSEEHFISSSSPSRAFLDVYHSYFGHSEKYLELSFDSIVDYFDERTRAAIMDLLEWPLSSQHATRAMSWLSEFRRFEKSTIYDINHETFVPVVKLVFLTTEPYMRFSSDLLFDRFQSRIVKSRMHLQLSQKGVAKKEQLISELVRRGKEAGLPLTIKAPFIFMLQHDLQLISSGMWTFGVLAASLFVLSLLLFAQPALSIILLITSVCVLLETIAYSQLLGAPFNIVTLSLAISANSLTCVIVMSFCNHFSLSGRSALSPTQRMQYSFQSSLVPVAFACFVPCISYLPILSVDAPIVLHLFKVLLVSSIASFIHFLLFIPNLLLLLVDFSPRLGFLFNCDLWCAEEEGSIYYIPTAPRAIHSSQGIYQEAEYAAYTLPKPLAPPSYLAIGPPEVYSMTREEREERRPVKRQPSTANSAIPYESTLAASEKESYGSTRRGRDRGMQSTLTAGTRAGAASKQSLPATTSRSSSSTTPWRPFIIETPRKLPETHQTYEMYYPSAVPSAPSARSYYTPR